MKAGATTFIEMLTSREPGADPRIHFWFKHGHSLKSLCDGREWSGSLLDADNSDFGLPCRVCRDLYADDIVHGRNVFQYRPFLAADYLTQTAQADQEDAILTGHTRYNGCIPQNNARDCLLQEIPMPKVPMIFFAKFCDAKIKMKQRMVRDQRQQVADPRLIYARDYYRKLREAIMTGHIKTQDIGCFEDVLSLMLAQKTIHNKRERFQVLGDSYVDFWSGLDASPFKAERGYVDISGLTITVNPEMRIHTGYGDDQVVKMWFSSPRISLSVRRTMSYLMKQAQEREGWPSRWQMGFLDIERRVVLPLLETDAGFASAVSGQAAAYMEMWNGMAKASEDLLDWD